MVLPVLVVLAIVVIWWLSRGTELFCLSVRDGRVLLVRGRVPAALLAAIRDVVAARPSVQSATIRAVRTDRGARLMVAGAVDDGRAQRLRNVFGLYPMSKLRSAPVATDRTVGQLLGIAWLAWLLDRSGR